ncbi:MAG TPA: DUF5335 family protein [Longimicrobiales bacterium]|nr:DUF5335 family protein [Longimicrobiales bacterium]
MMDTVQSAEWVARLHAFTNRNAGRRTIMEIDIPEYGAQASETDYPLWGVAFDPRDGRVQIMLGEQGSVEQHLTHSVVSPEGIEILTEGGRDRALRIAHGGGQTLLTFIETGADGP